MSECDIEYKIVGAYTADQLEKCVEWELEQGWKLYGSPFIVDRRHQRYTDHYYNQAMIKQKPPTE
jgi:hypothetical protein